MARCSLSHMSSIILSMLFLFLVACQSKSSDSGSPVVPEVKNCESFIKVTDVETFNRIFHLKWRTLTAQTLGLAPKSCDEIGGLDKFTIQITAALSFTLRDLGYKKDKNPEFLDFVSNVIDQKNCTPKPLTIKTNMNTHNCIRRK